MAGHPPSRLEVSTRRQVGRETSPPDREFVAALTDFGPGRSELFGNSADGYLAVYSRGSTEADVKEGSRGIWERLHYDWSDPNRVDPFVAPEPPDSYRPQGMHNRRLQLILEDPQPKENVVMRLSSTRLYVSVVPAVSPALSRSSARRPAAGSGDTVLAFYWPVWFGRRARPGVGIAAAVDSHKPRRSQRAR
jgi:hypothetical protein